MNILHTLKTPWIASSRSSRWLSAFTVIASAAFTTWAGIALRSQDRLIFCGVLWCLAITAWWLLVVPNALWVGRGATALQLPRVRRAANASVVLYALLSVLMPALLLATAMGHLRAWLVAFALTAAGCLAFMLLPPVLIFGGGIALGALSNMHELRAWQPSFAVAADVLTLPTLALIGIVVWRWVRLLDASISEYGEWLQPIIWQMRRRVFSRGFEIRADTATLAHTAPSWLQPTPDLRGVGPGNPIRSLRVALGRGVMPQTPISIARQAAVGLVLGVAPPLAVGLSSHDALEFFRFLFMPGNGWFLLPMIVGSIGVGVTVTRTLSVRSLWSNSSSGLALLALLPGFGNAEHAKRYVVRAWFADSSRLLGASFCALLLLGAMTHMLLPLALYATVCVAGTAAFCCAVVFGTLAGKSWINGVRGLAALVAVLTGLLLAIAGTQIAFAASVWASLIGPWLLFSCALGWYGWRAWRALQRRPHPFLANAR